MNETFEKLDSAEIERAEKAGECLGRNPDGGRIIDYVGACGGYFGETKLMPISRLVYVDEPPKPQPNRKPGGQKRGETYGYYRWDRLRNGRASFHPREARFVRDGLRRTHGDAWARAFPSDELVQMNFSAFLERVAELGLQVPIERIPPVALLKLLAAATDQIPLDLRVVDPTATRLGGAAGSRNQSLKAASYLKRHRTGEKYILQVRGLDPEAEQLFVFEVSEDALLDEDTEVWHRAFPTRLVKAPTANVTIRDEESPFEFFDIAGRFAFIALTLPADCDFTETFKLDPNTNRWDVDEFSAFAARLGEICRQDPSRIRFGLYEYELS